MSAPSPSQCTMEAEKCTAATSVLRTRGERWDIACHRERLNWKGVRTNVRRYLKTVSEHKSSLSWSIYSFAHQWFMHSNRLLGSFRRNPPGPLFRPDFLQSHLTQLSVGLCWQWLYAVEDSADGQPAKFPGGQHWSSGYGGESLKWSFKTCSNKKVSWSQL